MSYFGHEPEEDDILVSYNGFIIAQICYCTKDTFVVKNITLKDASANTHIVRRTFYGQLIKKSYYADLWELVV